MGESGILTPGTKRIIERNRQARNLLEWWEATNDPADKHTKLASDTRKWLAHMPVEVPKLETVSNDSYVCDLLPNDESSRIPPQQGHSDTTALSHAHELHHALLRKIDPDGLPDEHHKSNDSIQNTDNGSSFLHASHTVLHDQCPACDAQSI